MIHSSNVKYIKRSASSRVSSDNAHRPDEHLPAMRRLYKDLKSRSNNFGKGPLKSKDKSNGPHVTPNRSTTKTSNKIVADGIATTCSENTDDAISLFSNMDCLRFDQETPDDAPSLALYPRKLFKEDGGVEEEEEEDSLLGLQFLTDDDDNVHDSMIFSHGDIKVLFPSLTMSSSFCLSSDTDE